MGFLYNLLYDQFFVHPKIPTTLFTDQTIIVSGSNVGLGKEAARHFARLNAAKVILAVRNLAAGDEAKQDIESSTGRHGVCEVWHLDMASFASVKQFAARASTELVRLDAVVENAGIQTLQFQLAEGHERTITVNVISTFLLALLLLPKLKETAAVTAPMANSPRLTIVASDVHALTDLPERKEKNTFNALDKDTKQGMNPRYWTSKLLEVLVVRELAPRLARDHSDVILNMLNPGFCHSGLTREVDDTLMMRALKCILARPTEEGGRTLVAAAAAGRDSHGTYMSNGVVDDDALSEFVKSQEGQKTQKKVWKELQGILEDIQPGVTNVVET